MKTPLQQLMTPCLLLNQAKLCANIRRMQAKLDAHGVPLRQHGKTAKCVQVANAFSAPHNKKITVSTLKEAEYYLAHGFTDLLYAVGISANKLPQVARLISQGAQLKLVVDSVEQVQSVAAFAQSQQITIEVLIEIDCDDERAGVQVDDPQLLEIAQAIKSASGLCFKGIMTHAGGSYHCQSEAELVAMAQQERATALACVALLEQQRLTCEIVSVGSTPTALFANSYAGLTEVRAGVFVFQDLVMAGLGVCSPQDIGLSVLTSIIGKNTHKNWLLIDAGWMALSRDRGTQGQAVDYGYGMVCDLAGQPLGQLIVNSTNQEHGIIKLPEHHPTALQEFKIGQQLQILPNHACATAAMHDRYYVLDDSHQVSDIWERVNGW